jgi:GntR family transcriptional repressor for pyruvate dehydrogenase complex
MPSFEDGGDGTGRPAMAARVAAYLEGAILDRTFEPGAKLPTEGMLSQQFGVSRAVVREAIARVKAEGLVRSRQGSGLYVAPPSERRSFRINGDPARDTDRMFAFFELRRPMEVASARLAAARRSAHDLGRIAAAHEGMSVVDDWSRDGVDADLRLHHAIAVATHNPYYIDFMAFLGNVIGASMRMARAETGQAVRDALTIAEHALILRAIEAGDPDAAARAMEHHLDAARERMQAILADQPRQPS